MAIAPTNRNKFRRANDAEEPNVAVDLTAALSQIETNKTLEDAAFTVNVAPDAEPITLDELRDSGPLGR